MSYALGQFYTEAAADRAMGWTAKRRKAYWDARAKACTEFSDEGECLAQVARHVPVTIGSYHPGLGANTAQDVRTALNVTAGLFTNPDATLAEHGPKIVTAADKHVVSPLIGQVGEALVPYVLKYVLPVIAGLYVTTGVAAYYSYKMYKGKVRPNRRRKRRRRRRTSRR